MPVFSLERFAEWYALYQRMKERYIWFHGRPPSIFRPRKFSEKMQWRKLFDDNALFPVFCDKLAVRTHLAALGFGEFLIPLLWQGDRPEDVPFDALLRPAVLKGTFACNQYAILAEGELDHEALVAQARSWMSSTHAVYHIEPGYLHLPRRLMVETLLGDVDRPPTEYKLFVFDGRCDFIQVIETTPSRTLRTAYMSRDWTRLDWRGAADIADPVRQPTIFPLAFDVAERIGSGIDHIRVDLYDCDGCLYIGEITPYCWSGLVDLSPAEADDILGRSWNLRHVRRRSLRRLMFGTWDGRRSVHTGQDGPSRHVEEQQR